MKKSALATMSILAACLLSAQVNSASFDCNRAATWVEKTICKDSELSKLDEAMATQYKDKLATSSHDKGEGSFHSSLINDQKNWLEFQRNTCQDTACLVREYKERINAKSYSHMSVNSETLDDPNINAFGKFSSDFKIQTYSPKLKSWGYSRRVKNTLSIYRVTDKPKLSIVDGVLIFTNAHTCEIAESKAVWVQNHWAITDHLQDKNAELRLYPKSVNDNTLLLLRDIDNRYRALHCGMRGYFDGMVLVRERV